MLVVKRKTIQGAAQQPCDTHDTEFGVANKKPATPAASAARPTRRTGFPTPRFRRTAQRKVQSEQTFSYLCGLSSKASHPPDTAAATRARSILLPFAAASICNIRASAVEEGIFVRFPPYEARATGRHTSEAHRQETAWTAFALKSKRRMASSTMCSCSSVASFLPPLPFFSPRRRADRARRGRSHRLPRPSVAFVTGMAGDGYPLRRNRTIIGKFASMLHTPQASGHFYRARSRTHSPYRRFPTARAAGSGAIFAYPSRLRSAAWRRTLTAARLARPPSSVSPPPAAGGTEGPVGLALLGRAAPPLPSRGTYVPTKRRNSRDVCR